MLTIANRSIAGAAAVFGALLSVAAANPAQAETISIPVSYSGLNLSSSADAAVLDRRISHAADKACGVNEQYNRFQVAKCRKAAISNARADLKIAQAAPTGIVLAAQ